ncbi:ventricular zone-expressed PH domain-containing protein homolog 1 isoform X4 [Heliangelus exortis]|uniref:ventricular zone-expressed PH domain-containing protein homolog 1 isoform X4 n=1 Tax=Heliangelus exortis TaxID=472823 RepID=UPI003A93CE65
MHQLFGMVLAQKDLSRAGDLFSLEDAEIEGSLSEALEQIRIISSAADYQTNDNDQAVVEICITRITTAIRETASIEKHGQALVALWESCLEHNLKPSGKDEDTPHAKIASDIMSCILQNYNRPPVMALAVPVAVKFLQRGNKELCRNMSSYLSLAAIAAADLLADHTDSIVTSVLQGRSPPVSWLCVCCSHTASSPVFEWILDKLVSMREESLCHQLCLVGTSWQHQTNW